MRLIEFQLQKIGSEAKFKTEQQVGEKFVDHAFPINWVKTTKYTVFSFLPISILL
jgi:hypothetical protein